MPGEKKWENKLISLKANSSTYGKNPKPNRGMVGNKPGAVPLLQKLSWKYWVVEQS